MVVTGTGQRTHGCWASRLSCYQLSNGLRTCQGRRQLLMHRSRKSTCQRTSPASCRASATGVLDKEAKGGQRMETVDALPEPGDDQQTLERSFTVAGVGLHSGRQACVRVRPAHAGDGRYFVRVPEGTNGAVDPAAEADKLTDSAEQLWKAAEEVEEELVTDFLAFLRAQDEGYQEDFEHYMEELRDSQRPSPAVEEPILEEIQARAPGESVIAASLDNASAFPTEDALFTTLSSGQDSVHGAELLLAALEACGVDDARIEIEGGEEVPLYDGSSLGWVLEIQSAGVRSAPANGSGDHAPRKVLAPEKVVTVRKGESFVTLIPGNTTRITYGIDHAAEAPVIGRQWVTWDMQQDEHFRWTIAPARSYATSRKQAFKWQAEGYFKGASNKTAIIADGEAWHVEEGDLMIAHDEPVRHRLLELVGHLALLAEDGSAGLPKGHIIAFQAPHSLHLNFARAVRKVCSSST